jgi:hypothetical protein
MLPADAQPRHLASQLVEAKRNTYTLFARHAAVAFKLKFQCALRCHFEAT